MRDLPSQFLTVLEQLLGSEERGRLADAAQIAMHLVDGDRQPIGHISAQLLNKLGEEPPGAWYDRRVDQVLRSYPEGARLRGIIALATLLYRTPPTREMNATAAMLCSIRMTGGRPFLHPTVADATWRQLRGRYLLARLLSEVVADHVLEGLDLPQANRVYATISDTVLLLAPDSMTHVSYLLDGLRQRLEAIYPTLGLSAVSVNLRVQDFLDGNLGSLLVEANRREMDKRVERLSFGAGTPPPTPPPLLVYLESFTRRVSTAKWLLLRRTSELPESQLDPVGRIFAFWFCPSDCQADIGFPFRRESLLADVQDSGSNPYWDMPLDQWFITLGNRQRGGILRMDGNGSLSHLTNGVSGSLAALMERSAQLDAYFRTEIPRQIQLFNGPLPTSKQVLLLHASSDDIIAAGPYESLTHIADSLASHCVRNIGISLSRGYGIGRPGITASALSHAALAELINAKNTGSPVLS